MVTEGNEQFEDHEDISGIDRWGEPLSKEVYNGEMSERLWPDEIEPGSIIETHYINLDHDPFAYSFKARLGPPKKVNHRQYGADIGTLFRVTIEIPIPDEGFMRGKVILADDGQILALRNEELTQVGYFVLEEEAAADPNDVEVEEDTDFKIELISA